MAKSILITGCSSGIGYDAAKTLHARGWQVFASCRQQKDCDRLRAEGLNAPLIDYQRPDTIKSGLAEVLEATGGTLDALYNNGAQALPGLVEDIPTDGLRLIFEANFFGYHSLTTAVIPIMRRQGHGRIINCSSVLGFMHMSWRGAYVASKFALEGLTHTLRAEMQGSGIHVITLQPGPITTKIRHNSIPLFEKWVNRTEAFRAADYERNLDVLYGKRPPSRFELPPSGATKVLLRALEAPRPRACYRVTLPTHLIALLTRILPPRALDYLATRE